MQSERSFAVDGRSRRPRHYRAGCSQSLWPAARAPEARLESSELQLDVMSVRTTRAIHNLGATEALPGLSELTGNVNSIAEEANRISVQKVALQPLVVGRNNLAS